MCERHLAADSDVRQQNPGEYFRDRADFEHRFLAHESCVEASISMRDNPCRAISLDDSEYNADCTTFIDAGLDQRREILVGREMLSACGSRAQYHEREEK